MRHKYIRPQSLAALWSPRFGFSAAALFIFTVIGHGFGAIRTLNLPYFLFAVALLAAVGLILAFYGLKSLWQKGYKGGLSALKGGALSLIAALPLLCLAAAYFIFPPYADISTDFDQPPPIFSPPRPQDALPLAANFAPAAALAQKNFWPQLSGRRYDGSPDAVLRAVFTVLAAENWTVSEQKGKAGEDKRIYISARARTLIFGFVSDIIIRITDEGDTSFVDMRAASRYLRHDYGINARLTEDFMSRLDAEILSLPTVGGDN